VIRRLDFGLETDMLFRLLLAATLICLPYAASTEPVTSDEPQTMRFEWVKEGPAENCGDRCRTWVTASGPITKDAIKDFDFLSEVKDLKGATLVLDSGGGSVLASLELGRKVRALGMTTTVGEVTKFDTPPGAEQRGKLSPRAECASMCVFVLLGGQKRIIPPEARILVHQIWPGAKRYDASAETYTAEELVRVQRDVGRIARYTVEMGGDIELFELAMRIPPWERLRILTQGELRRTGLQTVETAEVRTSGAVSATPTPEKGLSAPVKERGWIALNDAKNHELLRRHPLTLEGEEIGRFELSFACGEGGTYKLAYLEARSLNADDAGTRLQDVVVRLGNERAVLSIGGSGPTGQGKELASHATGKIKPGFVEKLMKDPTAAILVSTRTSDNTRTSIRVGGTGLAKAYSQFAARCRN
jgi:hypothetical protein